ncbi:MAG: pyridoxamine 5'-phosphate oxidase family protein [Paracoccaceae bacterium]|nr:pyridoxamine 5'-phosphate oxidase family protein [Paracoccaceae bacterium]
MNEPFDDLNDFRNAAWKVMNVPLRRMPRVSLATVDQLGAPQLRTLVLRGANKHDGTVELHTDAASQKVPQLENDPRAAVLIWDEKAMIQIRLMGDITIKSDASLSNIWEQLPSVTQGNYGVMPPPGSKIAAGDNYSRKADAGKFAILELKIQTMDLVQLQEPSHRRAFYDQSDNWGGQWLAP